MRIALALEICFELFKVRSFFLGWRKLIGHLEANVQLLFQILCKLELRSIKEQNIGAAFATSGSPPCSVDETVYVRAARLDDDINVIDVETSSCHICADKNATGTGLFELLQCILTVSLRQVSMDRVELCILLGTERSRLLLCLCEDECFQVRVRRDEVVYMRQLR